MPGLITTSTNSSRVEIRRRGWPFLDLSWSRRDVLQYLDIVWETYRQLFGVPMPVDVWNFHAYTFPEKNPDGTGSFASIALGTDPALAWKSSKGLGLEACVQDEVVCQTEHDNIDLFKQQVEDMRRWMKEKGEQRKPLILTEFGLLYPYDRINNQCIVRDEAGECFGPARVTAFLEKSLTYLENATDPVIGNPLDNNRLVQQWLWFALDYDGDGMPSNLLTVDRSDLTQMGRKYRDIVASQPLVVNLALMSAGVGIAKTAPGATTTNVTVTATILNNGNASVQAPIKLTFYKDQAMTQTIGSTMLTAGIAGCVSRQVVAQVSWNDLATGMHRYWVKVDSDNQIVEPNEADNTGSGVALVNPALIYFPMVAR